MPKSIVYHYHGGTAGFESDFMIYYGNRNILWNAVKNYPISLVISSIPWIIGRNVAVIPYYIIKGHGKTIFRSKVDALKGISKMFAKRLNKTVKRKDISKFILTTAPKHPHRAKKGNLKILKGIIK